MTVTAQQLFNLKRDTLLGDARVPNPEGPLVSFGPSEAILAELSLGPDEQLERANQQSRQATQQMSLAEQHLAEALKRNTDLEERVLMLMQHLEDLEARMKTERAPATHQLSLAEQHLAEALKRNTDLEERVLMLMQHLEYLEARMKKNERAPAGAGQDY